MVLELDASRDPIERFVLAAKGQGVADESIVKILRYNGYSEKAVYRVLTDYYARVLGEHVPSRGGALENARDAFMYLVNFLTLGFWTVALGQLIYTAIDYWLPDYTTFRGYGSLYHETSWQIATIVVTFPVFACVDRILQKQLRVRPELYESGVRKWLTYLALVVAVVVALCDGIWFLNALLSGEMTAQFLAHAVELFVIAGGFLATT